MIRYTFGAFAGNVTYASIDMEATPFPGHSNGGDGNNLHEGDIFAVGCHVPADEIPNTKYALSKRYVSSDPNLKTELADLRSFFTAPVHINRRGGKIDPTTMEGYSSTVLDYLGFVKTHCGADYTGGLSLRLVTRGELLQKYLNFKKARGVSAATLVKCCQHIVRVLEYINAAESGAAQRGILHQLIETMGTIKRQVRSAAPARQRRTVPEMREDGTWVDWDIIRSATLLRAAAVISLCNRFRQRILDGTTATADMVQLASDLSDVLLTLLLTILPPTRPRTFRTLALRGKPADPQTCTTPACTICQTPTCQGNYLRRVDLNHYELLISHHKNGNKTKEVIGPIALTSENSTSTELLQVGMNEHVCIHHMPFPIILRTPPRPPRKETLNKLKTPTTHPV